MIKFIDYSPELILEQLEKVHKLEQGKLKDHPKVQAWKRWCESYEYRKAEWEWRQQYRQNTGVDR